MVLKKKETQSPLHWSISYLRLVGNMANELELPLSLDSIHLVFQVSMFKKCIGNPSLVVPLESVVVSYSLSYEEVPIKNLDKQVCRLQTKGATLVIFL